MNLRVAPGLELDADYIGGGTLALLAKKGAGKSYTARVLAEEMWKAKIPFVLIDPMGTSWGLRAGADGDEAGGLPIPIFGGSHADAPLERTGGALMADLVVDEGVSMILDLVGLGTRAAERQFAHDFLERLYRRNRELVHLLIDEADLFAPQKPQPGDAPLLGVTENIVRRGRNKGIGITLITQRPAVLNKDVLTQVDGLVAMRIIGKQDRDAIDAWVMGHGDQEAASEVKGTLAGLANGECWWWIPELDILKRVQVRASRTFDSSPTKRIGESRREPKSLAEIDMGTIAQKMEATIERAKAVDPKELRKQVAERDKTITRLERQLAERPAEEVVKEVTVEVPTPVFNGEPERLAEILNTGYQALDVFRASFEAARTEILDRLSTVKEAPGASTLAPRADPPTRPAPRPPRAEPRPARPAAPRDVDPSVSQAGQRILDTLVWLEEVGFPQPTKLQTGLLAGYRVTKKLGGTYSTELANLKASGHIDYPRPGCVLLTGDGRVIAIPSDIERSSAGVQRAILSRLDHAERRVLEELIAVYAEPLHKVELGTRAGYQVTAKLGGTFSTVLAKLKSLGLIEYPAPGLAVASDLLFLE